MHNVSKRFIDYFGDAATHWDVLEVGACDGQKTVGFNGSVSTVTCMEPQEQNLPKLRAAVSQMDNARIVVSRADDLSECRGYDCLFHCGVLYHLADPVKHWESLEGKFKYIWLNTHYTTRPDSELHGYRGWWYTEVAGAARSGLQSKSFWPTLPELLRLVRRKYNAEEIQNVTLRDGHRVEIACTLKMHP